MKEWKHLSLDQRKVIASGISHNYKLKYIGESLGFDPTSISKEVKRNRIATTVGLNINNCKRVNRWPYVFSGCNKIYNNCVFTKYKYVAQSAQKQADVNLINSRKGIDIDSDTFKKLDETIKIGIDNKKSIYQIKIENNTNIDKSVTTLYRYINKGYLTTKNLIYHMRLHIKKENIIKSMNTPKTIILTEAVILISII